MELLNFVYENAEMGVHTLNILSDTLRKRDNKIKGLIEDELKEYNNFLKESEKLLKKNKIEPKKTNLMAKLSSKMGITMETMKDNSDPAIASMVIEGLTMGIVEMQTKIENYKKLVGKPDIVFYRDKVAVFCDSEFWHGYDWENRKKDFKSNKDFWIPKIERNIQRDIEVTEQLKTEGWIVLRFWGKDIMKKTQECADIVERTIKIRREYHV